jgi:hypothetical protein
MTHRIYQGISRLIFLAAKMEKAHHVNVRTAREKVQMLFGKRVVVIS